MYGHKLRKMPVGVEEFFVFTKAALFALELFITVCWPVVRAVVAAAVPFATVVV
jgi:hypothetical protein